MYVHENWISNNGIINHVEIEKDINLFHEILARHLNIIYAIGETGFDLSKEILNHPKCKFSTKKNLIDIQSIAFETCINAAIKYDLPIILHLRAPWQLCMQKIRWAKNEGIKNIMIHCYSGSAEELKNLSKLSVYCSFGGVPTWKKSIKNRNAFVKCDPLLRLLETDSPDLPPEIPNFEKLIENEPGNLKEIAQILAPYLNISDIELIKSSNENTLRFLGLD